MRVVMTIDSDGVETRVSREYEPDVIPLGNLAHERGHVLETPSLDDVTQAVAAAAAVAHRITPKE